MDDLKDRNDLEQLLREFYRRLLTHERMRYIFTDIAKINLEAHLPRIVSFWEQVLWHTGDYRENVMALHLELNGLAKLEASDFELWLKTFGETVDENFFGPQAETAKTRALSIATVMKIKIKNLQNKIGHP